MLRRGQDTRLFPLNCHHRHLSSGVLRTEGSVVSRPCQPAALSPPGPPVSAPQEEVLRHPQSSFRAGLLPSGEQELRCKRPGQRSDPVSPRVSVSCPSPHLLLWGKRVCL